VSTGSSLIRLGSGGYTANQVPVGTPNSTGSGKGPFLNKYTYNDAPMTTLHTANTVVKNLILYCSAVTAAPNLV